MRAAALEPALAVRVVGVCSASIRVLLYLEIVLNEANLLKRHTQTWLSQGQSEQPRSHAASSPPFLRAPCRLRLRLPHLRSRITQDRVHMGFAPAGTCPVHQAEERPKHSLGRSGPLDSRTPPSTEAAAANTARVL